MPGRAPTTRRYIGLPVTVELRSLTLSLACRATGPARAPATFQTGAQINVPLFITGDN